LPDFLAHKAVSTWSLHRSLGNVVADDSAVHGGKLMNLPELPSGATLLELIPQVAAHGYDTLQVCHFHLESREAPYLVEVRDTLDRHGIVLDMLLIDDGDLTAADDEFQMRWYSDWLFAAEVLGANRARICAGRSAPTPERLQASGEALAALAEAHPDVRIVTENWMELTPDAASVLAVLDAAGDSVGLLIDLGNWSAPTKYDELAIIAPRAEACHAKCDFGPDGPNEKDFRRSLSILREAGFDGTMALIYDGPDANEFSRLEDEWAIVRDVFAG
jgi:sugar phosphate isomerase/epimerase